MITIGDIKIDRSQPFALIAGPCQIESAEHAGKMADALLDICRRNDQKLIFKSSFDKANRTSLGGARGVGIDAGLKILADIRARLDVPVITDVHSPEQCARVAEFVDILQIPAFLCRQTDLLIAAAKTGKVIMVKKGQFLAPYDMENVAGKITASGNPNVMLCDRGTSFGYNTLISDMRGLEIMAATGHPVIMDATHSTQSIGGLGGKSGGARDMAPVLARAALAVGVAGVFVEVHDDPDNAPCDGPAMMRLDGFEDHLRQWQAIDRVIKG